ncbi:hypothetical protein NECAME_09772 [Necator americanus]|uniref:Uncharacterized protein n=1 Tax=Necator americanus TaxID=51031 RepID=W2TCJ0_NECAM|nr:hypothetical protein NECAME_09772 [Necator americanus]ETN79563.1 hypothetical protein NECAME_09772 [Necator americanus]
MQLKEWKGEKFDGAERSSPHLSNTEMMAVRDLVLVIASAQNLKIHFHQADRRKHNGERWFSSH